MVSDCVNSLRFSHEHRFTKRFTLKSGATPVVDLLRLTCGLVCWPTIHSTYLQDELMCLIEKEGVPAPAPIEQRWTSSSSANMSPAHDGASPETVRYVMVEGSVCLACPMPGPALFPLDRPGSKMSIVSAGVPYTKYYDLVRFVASVCRQLFSWVGVIMYLPADDVGARKRVTDAFLAYRDLCKVQLWDK